MIARVASIGRIHLADPRSLTDYQLLGRSGVRVSPLSLGTMTFGETWGADAVESRRMFDLYLDRGGNFVDTANLYSSGRSEDLLGEFLAQRRAQVVLATKYSLSRQQGDPNRAGNHRKNMMQSVEESLRRLRTDYIDLYYLHVWDAMTPVEEVLRGFDDLVRQGKVIYVGISDTPAWEVSRMQAIAELRGWAPLIALQVEYSLVQRSAERDLLPMAKAMGIGVTAWSPLGAGLLAGRYSRTDLAAAGSADAPKVPSVADLSVGASGEGRKALNLRSGRVTEHKLAIAAAVKEVADELGRSSAQVALAWLLGNPDVAAPILGVRTVAQLEDNLAALSVEFTDSQRAALQAASQIELGFPHEMLAGGMARQLLTGSTNVLPRR
jgi:aryl-alcohol dehydrogenase-like predicted oxidoreductase